MRAVNTQLLRFKQRLSHSAVARQQYQGTASKMAAQNFSINATYTMNSGFEIPVLGYGVSLLCPHSILRHADFAGLPADLAITLHTGGPMQIVRPPVHFLPTNHAVGGTFPPETTMPSRMGLMAVAQPYIVQGRFTVLH
jgi:hypothetical protein